MELTALAESDGGIEQGAGRTVYMYIYSHATGYTIEHTYTHFHYSVLNKTNYSPGCPPVHEETPKI